MLGGGIAVAHPTRPSHGPLTPNIARLSSAALRSKSPAGQARALGFPVDGPASLLRVGRRYLVDVTFADAAAEHRAALRRAGARIVAASRRYRRVTVAARATRLRAVGRVDGVRTVAEDFAPVISGASVTGKRRSPCQGSVVSEADAQLGAAGARAEFGVDGSGVTVGILSDSFDSSSGASTHASGDVASHDLPGPGDPCGHTTPVTVLQDTAGLDEGRAMAQVVHDLAPGAKLSFATADLGEIAFANNIRALASAGADVIVDDVSYLDEPFFQDGPVSNAVNAVARAGTSYFSSATNNNIASGAIRDAGSLETSAFRDSGSCPPGLPSYARHCMDFDPSTGVDNSYSVTVGPHSTLMLDLQWAQPWYRVSTDLDMYVLFGGSLVGGAATSELKNVAGVPGSINQPFELIQATNTGGSAVNVDIAINRCDTTCSPSGGGDGGTPRLKLQFLENGDDTTFPNEYLTSAGGNVVGPSIFGHNGAAGAVSVAAVPFDNSSVPEDYSSPGPVTLYYQPVSGTTPAAALPAPQVLNKPNVAATDCAATTFFATFDGTNWRFCGTSEAAPHAAAVAALQLEAAPSATPVKVGAAQAQTARPVGSFTHVDVGAGLIDAVAAVDAMTAPRLSITSHPARRTRLARARFAFESSEPATFHCRLDGRAIRRCQSPKFYAVSRGRHTFAVKGTDDVGVTGAPAKFSWKVRRKHHHRHR